MFTGQFVCLLTVVQKNVQSFGFQITDEIKLHVSSVEAYDSYNITKMDITPELLVCQQV